MKIIADRSALLASLTLATGVVNKRNVSEILGHVLIDGMMGEARIQATDLDVEVSTHCPADIADPGMTTADAVRLREIVQVCGSEITLEHGLTDDPRLVVSSGRSRFRIPTLSPATFPMPSEEHWVSTFNLPTEGLKGLLESVAFAASKDIQGQYFLTGVHLSPEGGSLVAIATNKSRIAKGFIELPHGAEKSPGVSIPHKSVSQFLAALSSASDPACTISVSERKIRLRAGKTHLTSRVIDAPYPDVSRAIPGDTPETALVRKDDLSACIRRAMLTGDIGSEGEGVKITFTENSICVSGRRPESDSMDEVEATYNGPGHSLGVNAKYVLDALSGLGGDEITLSFGGDIPALKITSATDPKTVMAVGLRIVP